MKRCHRTSGFSLLLTLALLSLITVLVVGMVAVVRVESQAAENAEKIAQARMNALLALRIAVGQLQRYTGGEGAVTARADVAGGSVANPNWIGVWNESDSEGASVWLVSGNEGNPLAVNPGTSIAAPPSRSDTAVTLLYRSSSFPGVENVRVRKAEIRTRVAGEPAAVLTGRYAYWISDESLKVSLNVRADVVPPAGYAQYPVPVPGTAYPGLAADAASRAKLLTTGQVPLLSGSGNLSTFNSRWPSVTASAPRLYLDGAGPARLIPGSFNANSRSVSAWDSYLDSIPVSSGTRTAILNAPRPFRSLADFQAKLVAATDAQNAAEILDRMAPILGVRGDTFLVRAYGEAINHTRTPAEADYVSALAYCEALVQRTPRQMPGFGYRYEVVYFRWLGPDDI